MHGWSGRTEALTDLLQAGHHLALLPYFPGRTDQNCTEDRSPRVLPEGEVVGSRYGHSSLLSFSVALFAIAEVLHTVTLLLDLHQAGPKLHLC